MKIKLLVALSAILFLAGCTKDDPVDPCIDKDKINDKVGCIEIYQPVCGCDGKTYTNACVAEYRAGLKSWKKGPCPGDEPKDECIDPTKIDATIICPTHIDPVCGCDGVTYNNSCEAGRNGVLKWTPGSCTIDTTKIPCIEVCEDSCVTLKAPRFITMQSNPQQRYTYVWKPASKMGSNRLDTYVICPKSDVNVYLEVYITECRTPLKPIGWCGTTTTGNGGGQGGSGTGGGTVTGSGSGGTMTGILPGGCYNRLPAMQTRLLSVTQYCIKIKDCDTAINP